MPKDVGPFFDKLVLVLYRLSKPSSAGEVLRKDSSLGNEEAVSRGLPYLTYLGIAERKKGGYELTSKGREIGLSLAEKNAEQVNLLWKEALRGHALYSLVKEYIETKCAGGTGSSIGLGDFLREKAGQDWGSFFVKEGGKRLALLLQSKGLVQYDEKQDIIGLVSLVEEAAPSTARPAERAPEREKTGAVLVPARPRVTINLSIEIGKDTPPETIDRVLRVVEGAVKGDSQQGTGTVEQ
jgi:hypothetical protein